MKTKNKGLSTDEIKDKITTFATNVVQRFIINITRTGTDTK